MRGGMLCHSSGCCLLRHMTINGSHFLVSSSYVRAIQFLIGSQLRPFVASKKLVETPHAATVGCMVCRLDQCGLLTG